MANCGNCRNKLSCGCKTRKASDGKSCCVSCVTNYERQLKQKKSNTPAGTIINVTATQKK